MLGFREAYTSSSFPLKFEQAEKINGKINGKIIGKIIGKSSLFFIRIPNLIQT